MESEIIKNMVNDILAGNNASAHDNFNTAVAERLTAALDGRKQAIAASLGQSNLTQEEDNENETVQ
jgi:hypothetical protein